MGVFTMHTTYTQGQLNRFRDWFIYVSSGHLQIFFEKFISYYLEYITCAMHIVHEAKWIFWFNSDYAICVHNGIKKDVKNLIDWKKFVLSKKNSLLKTFIRIRKAILGNFT